MLGVVCAQGWEVVRYKFCDRDREKSVLAYRQASAGMAIAPAASKTVPNASFWLCFLDEFG